MAERGWTEGSYTLADNTGNSITYVHKPIHLYSYKYGLQIAYKADMVSHLMKGITQSEGSKRIFETLDVPVNAVKDIVSKWRKWSTNSDITKNRASKIYKRTGHKLTREAAKRI